MGISTPEEVLKYVFHQASGVQFVDELLSSICFKRGGSVSRPGLPSSLLVAVSPSSGTGVRWPVFLRFAFRAGPRLALPAVGSSSVEFEAGCVVTVCFLLRREPRLMPLVEGMPSIKVC